MCPADFLLDPLEARRSGNVVGLDPQSFAISADRIHALAGLHQRFGLSEPAIRIVGGEANRLLVRGQRIGGPARPEKIASGIAPGLGIVPADVRAVSAARRLMRTPRGPCVPSCASASFADPVDIIGDLVVNDAP